MPDNELCMQHTQDLNKIDRKLDRVIVTLCGGMNEDGSPIEGHIGKTNRRISLVESVQRIIIAIASPILVGVVVWIIKGAL